MQRLYIVSIHAYSHLLYTSSVFSCAYVVQVMMHYSLAALEEALNALDGEGCYRKVSTDTGTGLIEKRKTYKDKEG